MVEKSVSGPVSAAVIAKSVKISITGIVQGVGFRPFVYQLAHRYALKGAVRNSYNGVELEIEGEAGAMALFFKALREELPPLARIDTMEISDGPPAGFREFTIVQSEKSDEKRALVSPDIAVCDNCLREMQDPANRRYGYSFINCTDCGPRYSIIETLPYDRPNTSMRFFAMCKQCQAEYANPLDRRFHAQPISCFSCGPTLSLLDAGQNLLCEGAEAVATAAAALLEGKIVAVKGLGGFHLLCDATDSEAVSALRKRKKRPGKPFAVMFPDMDAVKASASISTEEAALITSKERPIVIVSKRKDGAVYEGVAPGIDRIGVFLAYTPLHHLLLARVGRPVVATSANLSDEPIIRESAVLVQRLGHVFDLVLDHDRAIVNANDDSVMQIAAGKRLLLRMARGFAPKSISLPYRSSKKILAVGANQKNSIALAFDDKLIISPHIGDLNSIEAFDYFERTLETFQRLYGFTADVVVCDKHPAYETTKWAHRLKAKNERVKIIELQHHYAHLLAVMAEHNLSGRVLGFAFDGTGYGDDGTIWGGEVMIADEQRYTRQVSLRPFRLLGGEKGVREPRRSALSLLFEYLSLDEVLMLELPLTESFSKEELTLLHRAWQKGLNAPYTSSMGRLFDAVASFADIVQLSGFEGEGGLKMEQYVDAAITQRFDFSIEEGRIELGPMVRAIIKMREKREIASMFFNTLVAIISEIAEKHPELPLVFSGGVFQNRVLMEMIDRRCTAMKRKAYFQNETAVNDGGIALGQAWYALHNRDFKS